MFRSLPPLPSLDALLLFPGPTAYVLSRVQNCPHVRGRALSVVVVIDGTWREAKHDRKCKPDSAFASTRGRE
jgi:DTW domain-containing protein YfiP